MTLNVDYNLADGTWVRKALPENLRLEGEDDAAFAQRCGDLFAFDKGWSVAEKLHDVTPNPAPAPTLEDRVAALEAAAAKVSP